MRLRDFGLSIGTITPGPTNSIVDVDGIRVGHAAITTSTILTGVTSVIVSDPPRRTFVGRYSVDGGDGMTGLGVIEDFGALSAPIVFAPAAATGRVYNGMIQYGFGVDSGLSEDAGWPPVIVPINDTGVNLPEETLVATREEHLKVALESAGNEVIEGSVGIGAGLVAFGFRGGVGTSSRFEGGYTVGALVVANGGEAGRLSIDGHPVVTNGADDYRNQSKFARQYPEAPRSFAAIVATDAPLSPRELNHLAGRAVFGLVRSGLLDAYTQEGVALAVSTTGLIDGDPNAIDGTVGVRMIDQTDLSLLFAAAGDACEEAVLNALLQANSLPPMPNNDLPLLRQRGLNAFAESGWIDQLHRNRQRHG